MTTTHPRMTTAARWGWGILVAVCGLLMVNGVALYLFIVDTQIEQTIGVLLTAFGALGLMAAIEGYRHGTRWAGSTTWVLVVSLVAIGAHTLRADRLDVPATYFVLAALALVGQVLARRGEMV
jgi:hypothetical protein